MIRLLLLISLLSVPGWTLAAEPLVYRGDQTLWQDTVWSGEVLIDGILTVAPEVTLDIRPGTTIRFTSWDSNGDGIGEHELFIQGTLLAQGSADQPIRFTSAAAEPHPGDWGALNLMASEEESRLEHCLVEYAYRGFHGHFSRARLTDSVFRHNVRGVQFQESQVVLQLCRVVDNGNGMQFRDSAVTLEQTDVSANNWGLRSVYSQVQLINCRFENNQVNGVSLRDSEVMVSRCRISGNRKGLYLQRARGEVLANEISANSEHGIFLEKSAIQVHFNRIAGNGRAGIKWLESSGELRDNLFLDNGEYALINESAAPLVARGNGWGSSQPAVIADLIRDGADRSGAGLVDAGDPLTEPPAPPLP